ncbi:hypothetical protein C0J52_01444 [Blattella germanica]|nr:hypothetical protein C0J52_01444 [Blattella germanica]
MAERIEQRYCIKFCQNLAILKVKQLVKRFKNGHRSVESDERPGRPQTARRSSSIRFLTLATTAAFRAVCGLPGGLSLSTDISKDTVLTALKRSTSLREPLKIGFPSRTSWMHTKAGKNIGESVEHTRGDF